jgi:hypothetical protein
VVSLASPRVLATIHLSCGSAGSCWLSSPWTLPPRCCRGRSNWPTDRSRLTLGFVAGAAKTWRRRSRRTRTTIRPLCPRGPPLRPGGSTALLRPHHASSERRSNCTAPAHRRSTTTDRGPFSAVLATQRTGVCLRPSIGGQRLGESRGLATCSSPVVGWRGQAGSSTRRSQGARSAPSQTLENHGRKKVLTMSWVCPNCARDISSDDTLVFEQARPAHFDCKRPRALSPEERILLFAYCREHGGRGKGPIQSRITQCVGSRGRRPRKPRVR